MAFEILNEVFLIFSNNVTSKLQDNFLSKCFMYLSNSWTKSKKKLDYVLNFQLI